MPDRTIITRQRGRRKQSSVREENRKSHMTGPVPRPQVPTRRRLRPGKVFAALLRRLLYIVVRTQVTPERAEELGIDLQRPICYVLQDRHLSSVLVLEEEAHRLGLPDRKALGLFGRPQPESA